MKISMLLKAASWLPAILTAIIISGFSGQDAAQSQGLSDRIAGYIVNAAGAAGIIDADDEEKLILIEKLQFPIRKGAHMTEYAIFTCTVMFAFSICRIYGIYGKRIYAASVAVTFLYAASDEIHQLFVPGRSGQFTDVLIDTLGGIIAVLLVIVLKKSIRAQRRKGG